MQKSAVASPLCALAAGVVGFFLRRLEIATAFEGAMGLAKRNSPVTVALVALSAAFAVFAVVFAAAAARKHRAEPDFVRAFAPRGFAYILISLLIGLTWIAATAMHLAGLKAGSPAFAVDIFFAFLSALAAFSSMALARGAYKGVCGSEMLLGAAVLPLFFCFWLIVLYKNNASNPVLLAYCYECLAAAAAATCSYYGAGFVFGRAAPGKTLATHLLATYFCLVAAADDLSMPLRAIFIASAAYFLINTGVFIRNLKPKASD